MSRTMKNLKKVIALIMAGLMLASFAGCSNNKDSEGISDVNQGNSTVAGEINDVNQGDSTVTGEIYDFKVNVFGNTYSLPCELNMFKDNGWEYKDNKNPESDDVNGNRHAYSDIIKEGKIITITVFNSDADAKKFADCKVGSLYCEFSSENDLTLNLVNKLSANKDTTIEDVTKKFGDPTKTLNDASGTTLRYQKDTYAYYIFTFNTEGQLTTVDIRNR